MPKMPLKPCAFPTCGKLTDKLYCEAHSNYRPEKHASLYNAEWRKKRANFLLRHPFCECVDCKKSGKKLLATVVDHKTAHKGNKKLFWDEDNWQAMTVSHHNRKTAKHDRGSWGV